MAPGNPSLTNGTVAVLAAVRSEIAPLIRRAGRRVRLGGDSFAAWEGSLDGSRLLLVLTGMGAQRAEQAARLVLNSFPLSMLLSVGFCGALSADLRVGDLVLCSRLVPADRRPGPPVVASDPDLVQMALRLKTRNRTVILGSSLAVDRVIRQPVEKQSLRARTGADVVEMESYWIGQVCMQKEVPFLALRVVSDQADEPLPDLGEANNLHGSAEWAATWSLLRHPGEWGKLQRLLKNLRVARASLDPFLVDLIAAGQKGIE